MAVKLLILCLALAAVTKTALAVDVDYMQLVQSWPPSVCQVITCSTSDFPERFVIHGLWPEKRRSMLQYCTKDPFDKNKIMSLVPELNNTWIALGLGSNDQLWKHEWEKHGTCSNLDIVHYFEHSMEQFGKYNLETALGQGGIKPGMKSTAIAISNAIYSALGVVPTIYCKNAKAGGLVLNEVSLCFDMTANALQNCTERPFRACGTGPIEFVKKNP